MFGGGHVSGWRFAHASEIASRIHRVPTWSAWGPPPSAAQRRRLGDPDHSECASSIARSSRKDDTILPLMNHLPIQNPIATYVSL
jgi:hypothetical protein